MTIEHKPGHNGRSASGERFERPRLMPRRRAQERARRPGGLRLLMPLLLALALLVVVRGIAEAPGDAE
ncbi:MAG TPA: hypothetical protein VIE40_00610 [Dehalococcoidia bacterium]